MTLFESLCKNSSDINEHLETLRDLAMQCNSVVELGVRSCVSTWAFIEGMNGGTIVSVDVKNPREYGGNLAPVEKACANKSILFKFIEKSSLDIELPEVDMIFFDTLHTYDQLSQEIKLHADKAQKFLVFHDTVSCEDEIMPAIKEFMKDNKKSWKVKEDRKNNNGLLVLEKIYVSDTVL